MASLDVDNNIAKELATTTTSTSTKCNKRKRKIDIKKVEQQNKLHVTFSKRKQGLFNKLIELSFLCEAKTALIITSPNGKFYTCGYPNPDTVIQNFLAGANPFSSNQQEEEEEKKVELEDIRVKYEEIQDKLKEEKKKLQVLIEANKSSSSFPSWWNNPIEDMNLECLEEFKSSLERLKLNLINTMEAKKFSSLQQPLPLAVAPPTTSKTTLSNYSLMNECFLDQQENSDFDATCSSFMVPPPTTTTTLSNHSLINECFLDQQENYDFDAACSSFMVPPTALSNYSLLDESFLGQQENYDVAGGSSSFMFPTDFGNYY